MKKILTAAAGFLIGAAGIAQARSPDTVTIAFGAESTTLDPVKVAAGVDMYFVSQMFEQLLRPIPPDDDGKPWLAESYKVDPNAGKPIIDVQLRPGVKFHNGDPLTAEDFQFAFQRMSDGKYSRLPNLQQSVDSFEIVDPLHFRLHFKEGDATYVTDDLRLFAIPKNYILKVGPDEFEQHPVGTGPWRFVSRKIKDEIRFERFPDYWNKDHMPTAKNLVIKVIPEDLTRVAAFKTGEVDLIDAVPVASIAEVKKLPGVKTATLNSGDNLFFSFDTEQPDSPFRDLRVRQAAAYAIDIDAIIKNVLFGQGQRYTQLGPGEFGYDPDLKPLPFDPKKSRELLAAAGYPHGFDTPCYTLTTPREPNIKEMAEAAYAYLTAAGIRCHVVGLEYSAWLKMKRRWPTGREMDGVLSDLYGHGGLPGDPDLAWASTMHSFVPSGGWGASSFVSDPAVDKLIEEQKHEMDPAKRLVMVRNLARIKNEQLLAGITTYRPLVTFAWHDDIDFSPWAMPGYWHQMQEIGVKAK
jgi:peptide/nickel transport system substrate-binding protein